MSTTPILGITELASGQIDQFITANEAFQALEAAANDNLAVSFSGTSPVNTVTLTNDQLRGYGAFICSGQSAAATLNLPSASPQYGRLFVVINSGSFDLAVVGSGGGSPGVTVSAGQMRLIYTNGVSVWGAS